MNKSLLALALGLVASAPVAADFSAEARKQLLLQSERFFGIIRPLNKSESVSVPRVHGQKARDLIRLTGGLKAEIVTRKAANNSDMMAFWPNDNKPTHIVTCVEDDNASIGKFASGVDKLKPSVQTVNLSTGEVKTILHGMSGCDGIRRTPWGTIVATEEEDDGGLYEILNPLKTIEQTLAQRAAASDSYDTRGKPVVDQVAYRGALGSLAYEGLDLTAEGVVYYGDELRPGAESADSDGGSLFKFVPKKPLTAKSISKLSESPLTAGTVYAFQASCQPSTSSSFPQFGQGCETGQGAWVKVDTSVLRGSALAYHATGYYRPEDGHFDPNYKGNGVKFCWTNTGNKDAENYGEVMCITDTKPLGTGNITISDKTPDGSSLTYLADTKQAKGLAVAVVDRILEGDSDLNQPDNLAFQPKTGNMYVIEDNPFGDIWACLPGSGREGCVKMLSVRDGSAEPTGFTFTGDGKTAYFHIQHSDDRKCRAKSDCAANDGYGTDDLIKVTGFRSVGTTEARIIKGLATIEAVKKLVEKYYNEDKGIGIALLASIFSADQYTSQFVKNISIDAVEGFITVEFDTNEIPSLKIGRNTIILTPNILDEATGGAPTLLSNFVGATGPIVWACASETAAIAYTKSLFVSFGTLPSALAPFQCQ
jgi:hypothetical protein